VRSVAMIFLSFCAAFGASACYAEDNNKQTLSLGALQAPLAPPNSTLTLAPDPTTSAVTPQTGYVSVPARNGLQTPFLGLSIKTPLDFQK
jgi:hypothetical protein